MEDGRDILAGHELWLIRRRLCGEVSCLWIVVLGTRMRLLANDDAIGIVMCHGRVLLGQIILLLVLVLVLVRYHGHGALACKRRGRELGYHGRGGVGHRVVSLLPASVGTARTWPIVRPRKSIRHGAHVKGPYSGWTLWLRHVKLRCESMLRRAVKRVVLLMLLLLLALLRPKCERGRRPI